VPGGERGSVPANAPRSTDLTLFWAGAQGSGCNPEERQMDEIDRRIDEKQRNWPKFLNRRSPPPKTPTLQQQCW
jgi:hypothetical protein